MTAIAAEAGISKPILYRHFGDKGGLYRALAERHTHELLATIRGELTRRRGLPERTSATIDAYLAAIAAQPQLYRFLIHRASAEDAGTHSEMSLFVRRVGDEVGRAVAAEARLTEPDDLARAHAWGHAIVGMVRAAGDWWLDHREVGRDAMVRSLVDLLWGAFPRTVAGDAASD